MKNFSDIIGEIKDKEHKEMFVNLIEWVESSYPKLDKSVKWSQPCFEYQGTFIIAFTPYKEHIAVNIEKTGIKKFSAKLDETEYTQTDMTFRIKWNQAINYDLLTEMIEFQLTDKEGYPTYWRKETDK